VVESAQVVVIGGGAMGASIAWHLRELGVAGVVLLERDALASGSTSKSAGGFRTQFADELNVREVTFAGCAPRVIRVGGEIRGAGVDV